MRELETSKKKIEISPEIQKINSETISVLKKGGRTMLDKNLTLNLIEYLVNKRMSVSNNQKAVREKTKPVKLIIPILSIILTLVMIGFALYHIKPSLFDIFKNKKDSSIDVMKFAHVQLYGKNEILDCVTARITRILNFIDELSDGDLAEKITPTIKNFILYGNPGTGKTLFVKKVAYHIERNLRIKELREKHGESTVDDWTNDELEEKIKKVKSKVRFILVDPSNVNHSLVGESEKEIKALFVDAKDSKGHEVSIMVIDEADSILSKREDVKTDHGSSSRSQFLMGMDGVCTDLKTKLIIFSITNFQSKIDLAILRRHSNKIYFALPNTAERECLIKNMLSKNSKRFSSDEIQELVDLSNKLSQSQITRIFIEIFDHFDTISVKFDFSHCKDMFQKYKRSLFSKEAELIETDFTLRKNDLKYIYDPNTRKRQRNNIQG
ncbi:AAA ATPase [Hamiltosporidium tvaerminnensis]|uniref:AAA ATPase n=1 Tax=Hamiltosporidium tvaerminnensis TaxID=1176355 RepID=A0A4Q9KSP4_9MICR|nr:AAA ATPase [Hamiltosporidium tvaerminnensis]TBU15687.1 AAA ATPase [Hamiltosporidium tvaerminnensis]